MISEFLLWSGNDIPFPPIQVFIHQPTMKELSFIEENDFFVATRLLTFSKDKINAKDKIGLKGKSNFEIIMSILNNSEDGSKNKGILVSLLSLLFPDYKVNLEDRILLVNMEDKQNPIRIIDEHSFDIFASIVKDIFRIDEVSSDRDFNPVNEEARKIAEMIKRGRAKAARDKGLMANDNLSLFKHYSKILCMNGYTPEDTNNLTLYQLYELVDIYKNKIIYEDWYKAKLQGAKDIDDVDHWINLSNRNKN